MQKIIIGFLLSFVINSFANAATQQYSHFTDQGSGPALVLIHAFPADHHLWDAQLATLSKKFRVITIDLTGFGTAPSASGAAISMREYADEVKTLLDRLKIDKAIIGGESMGGYVSLAFLKAYPQATAGLILADTQAIADTDAQKAKREQTAQDVLKNGSAKLIDDFVPKAVSPNADPAIKTFLKDLFRKQSPEGIASALRGMALREDTMDQLNNLTIPVLIISGDLDVVIPTTESIAMHNTLPSSKLVIIHGAGHLTNVERPIEWNEAVMSTFVSESAQ